MAHTRKKGLLMARVAIRDASMCQKLVAAKNAAAPAVQSLRVRTRVRKKRPTTVSTPNRALVHRTFHTWTFSDPRADKTKDSTLM